MEGMVTYFKIWFKKHDPFLVFWLKSSIKNIMSLFIVGHSFSLQKYTSDIKGPLIRAKCTAEVAVAFK